MNWRNKRIAALVGTVAIVLGAGIAVVAQNACACNPPTPESSKWPSVTGTAEVGQVLTTDHGTWVASGNHTGESDTYIYQWKQCNSSGASCVDATGTGATSTTYTVSSGDVDHTLRSQVTATASGKSRSQTSSPTNLVTTVSSTLRVSGNEILKGDTPIHLRGAFYVSFEWGCINGLGNSSSATTQAVIDTFLAWHINFIRIGIPEDCWLGINGAPQGSTAASYKTALSSWLDLLHANGIYTEIGLMYADPGTTLSTQQGRMPDQDHSPAFWTSFATYFKGEPDTIFSAYGEPDPPGGATTASWSCLLNGSSPVDDCTSAGLTFAAMGMQQIVTTIRDTGNTLPILIPGRNWSTDLSKWIDYKPTDPLNQLGATWDQYVGDNPCFASNDTQITQNATCWNGVYATVAASYPLVNGEVGELAHQATSDCSTLWNLLPTYLAWAETNNVGYAAWKWGSDGSGTCGNLALVTSSSGDPTATWGVSYKAWIISKQ